jgi:hypothetical protein
VVMAGRCGVHVGQRADPQCADMRLLPWRGAVLHHVQPYVARREGEGVVYNISKGLTRMQRA